jgi:hypothetical protein
MMAVCTEPAAVVELGRFEQYDVVCELDRRHPREILTRRIVATQYRSPHLSLSLGLTVSAVLDNPCR